LEVIYDHKCPICRYAVTHKLPDTLGGSLTLTNARESSASVQRCWRQGINLNRGFVVIDNDQQWVGYRALRELALRAQPKSRLQTIFIHMCRITWIAACVYSVMVAVRFVVLAVMRIPRLTPSSHHAD
jgi:predicted DCC family thiol-disulfide oxidoreductase YuxK